MREEKQKVEIIPIGDTKALAEFFEQPRMKIAEAITGALASGRQDVGLAAGRIVQGALKGRGLIQVGREIQNLIEKGKISEDYAEKRYGFQSLSELLNFIDAENPDEERLLAVEAMFFCVNSIGISDGEQIANYQLFQLSKRLSSTQLLMLKVVYDFHLEDFFSVIPGQNHISSEEWFGAISEKLGHDVIGLLEQDDRALVEIGLVAKRIYSDGSGVSIRNGGLTDLGVRFCENIKRFEKERVS